MNGLCIEYTAETIKGSKKTVNCDRVLAMDHILSSDAPADQITGETLDPFKAVICAGIGDDPYAADLSARSFLDIDIPEMSAAATADFIRDVNRKTVENVVAGHHSGSVCTLAGLFICNGRFIGFSIGGCRLYTFKGNKLARISRDYTSDSVLSRFLGTDADPFVSFVEMGRITEGSVFLVCSDVICRALPDVLIEAVLRDQEMSLQDKHSVLMGKAVIGSRENDLSLILVRSICIT